MRRRIAVRFAAAGIALICVGPLAPALAGEDGPLVWAPSRTGANAYKLRLGLRSVGRWEAASGAELAMKAAPSGKIVPPEAPVRLWGSVSRQNGPRAAARSSRVSMGFNPLTGTGNVGAGTARTWIVTPTVDAEVQRNIAVQCNVYEKHCDQPKLTQSARLSSTATKTSIAVESGLSAGGFSGLDSIGVEQGVGNLMLGAAVADPLLAPRSLFTLRYSWKW
ncbi:hypothetical protein [Sinorhizobium alkalisoli]|uniref:Uncharacterized protein n=1 Tax=Sinorhizobium alkalisoli TaxID=1752398 RepID=A0A1E3VI73_9HYPH|nr:hypothetical protein [Sinorhizobium alkalisoli]MCA1489805.1 hypothetical protein [Ensifer sp. NBAIM29]MCG5481868.1 hypothetical protein [Sinorhizobium alkalisoli]ODR93275.1 hypothetical protein A8M32_00575 [Sinorhizobium alkalisoli]